MAAERMGVGRLWVMGWRVERRRSMAVGVGVGVGAGRCR